MTLPGLMGDDDRRDPDRHAIRALHDELQDMGRRFERLEERLGHLAGHLEDVHQIRVDLSALTGIEVRLGKMEALLRGNGEGGVIETLGRLDERVTRLESEDDKAEGSRGNIYRRLDDLNARVAGLKGSAGVWGAVAGIVMTVLLSWLLGGGL